MDPGDALEAVRNLGTLLMLDVPFGMEFGLDGIPFITGEKFKGIKMIPPGVHYLSTDPTRNATVPAPVSTFLFLKPSEILVYRWNPRTEQLETLDDEDEVDRLRGGVQRFDFDDGLGPYDVTHWRQWQRLSHRLDDVLVDRLMHGHRWISVAEEARGADGLSMKIPSEAALIRQLQSDPAFTDRPQRLAYTPFPLLITREGCTAAEISALNLDKTDALTVIMDGHYNGRWERLLGEVQFAFVTFLFGQSLAGLEQWKHMLHLLLGCFEGPVRFPSLFGEFLKVVRYQLQILIQRGDSEDPADASEMLEDSFLKMDLTEFLNCGASEDSSWHEDVKKEGRKLQAFIRDKLRWAEPLDDDYAPVVVQ